MQFIYPLRLQYIEETYPKLLSFRTEIDSLERIWIAALMEMQPKNLYPMPILRYVLPMEK